MQATRLDYSAEQLNAMTSEEQASLMARIKEAAAKGPDAYSDFCSYDCFLRLEAAMDMRAADEYERLL